MLPIDLDNAKHADRAARLHSTARPRSYDVRPRRNRLALVLELIDGALGTPARAGTAGGDVARGVNPCT